MTMISVNEFKSGLTIEHNNDLWRTAKFQHVKPGKGSAFVRSELKSLKTGTIQGYTLRSTEKVNTTNTQIRPMQYLYNDNTSHVFMDMNTYERPEIPNPEVERESKPLKENIEVDVIMHKSEALGTDLPNTVGLEVAETEPGIRGDTSSGDGKPATVGAGLVVNVPFFINAGDILTINTSDSSYVSRANK